MFLLYLWDSLVTLELISLIPLVGSPFTDPLAVKLLDNRLYMSPSGIRITDGRWHLLWSIHSTDQATTAGWHVQFSKIWKFVQNSENFFVARLSQSNTLDSVCCTNLESSHRKTSLGMKCAPSSLGFIFFNVGTPSEVHLFGHLLWPLFQSSILFTCYIIQFLYVSGPCTWWCATLAWPSLAIPLGAGTAWGL